MNGENMKDYEQAERDHSFNMQTLLQMIRTAGAVLGIIVMIIGIVYATRIFSMVSAALQNPEGFESMLKLWVDAVGGERLDFVVPDVTTYHAANLVALAVLGVGTVILSWISINLILVGAKALSWSLNDRVARKRQTSSNAASGGSSGGSSFGRV